VRRAQRSAAGLAAAACLLAAFASSASAVTRTQLLADALQAPVPSVPVRDAVIERPNRATARSLASASAARYPVNDGAGRSVEINVSGACQIGCSDASPTDVQNLANFLGSIIHGDEMNSAVINMVTPLELGTQCGPGALSCYYPSSDLIILNGNNTTASDGATRDYVLAHEYGHHVANHRDNSPFSNPALDTGPKNWATYERVCEGTKSGVYYPGDEADHYYNNPGEAWAETYAQRALPGLVGWEWNIAVPNADSLQAMNRDVANPWNGPTRVIARGGLRARKGRATKLVKTPLDGDLTLKLRGPRKADFDLLLLDANGKRVAGSSALGSRETVNYTVCGQASLRAVVKRMSGKGRFKLVELAP
jgi:hypothetical protein